MSSSGGLKMPAIFNALHYATHAAAIVTTGLMVYLYYVATERSLFSYHPTLMAVAFLLFQAQGILAAVHFRCLIGEARVAAIWRHVYWSGPGNVIMLAGFYAIYQTKIANGKDHFTTLHAKVGLATMVMSIGAQFGGAMSFRAIGLLDKFPAAMRPLIKTAHRNAGSVAWLMGLATIELSLCYPSMAKGAYTPLLQAGVAFMGAAMVGMSLLGQPMSAKSKAQ